MLSPHRQTATQIYNLQRRDYRKPVTRWCQTYWKTKRKTRTCQKSSPSSG